MVFTDPFIPLHELPHIRLWEELRDHIIDRRDLSWLIRAWGYDPYPPAIPSAGDAVWRLTYATSCCRQHIDWVAEEIIDKDDMVEGPDIPQLKTVAKLHLDAFGYDSTGWDDPDAPPVLTYPCTMHYRAWDDIRKMVLEVDKNWYTYPYQDGWYPAYRLESEIWAYQPYTTTWWDTWAEAKQNALDNMVLRTGITYRALGRRMYGYRRDHSGSREYRCNAYARQNVWAEEIFGWDFSGLIETPTLDSVFIGVKWNPIVSQYYRSPLPVDIYIGDHLCTSVELATDVAEEKLYLFELEQFDQSNYTFDGTKYDVKFKFTGSVNAPVGDGEFPAPGLEEYAYWDHRVAANSSVYDPRLEFKMFYHFTWP